MKFVIPVTKTSNVISVSVMGKNYMVDKDRTVTLPNGLPLAQVAHLGDLGWMPADSGTVQALADATGKTPAEIESLERKREAEIKAGKGEEEKVEPEKGKKKG